MAQRRPSGRGRGAEKGHIREGGNALIHLSPQVARALVSEDSVGSRWVREGVGEVQLSSDVTAFPASSFCWNPNLTGDPDRGLYFSL